MEADGVAAIAASAPRLERGAQAADRAMKGVVRTLEVDIGPNQLKDLVLAGPPLAAIKEKREETLGLAAAGLFASPAANWLSIAIHAKRTQRKDVQPGCAACHTRQRLAQHGSPADDCLPLSRQRFESDDLLLVPLCQAQ